MAGIRDVYVRPEQKYVMANQVIGYYSSHKKKALRGFEASCALMRSSLVARYGKELANTLEDDAHLQYEKLIPEIPCIQRALNTFLLISAQELAVYKALAKHGKSPGEAWELCHETLRLRLAEFPQRKRGLMRRFMFRHPEFSSKNLMVP